MKFKEILLTTLVLTSVLALATDPPVYRHRLSAGQLDRFPLVVIKHEAIVKGDLATIVFHVKRSDVVDLSSVRLVVRDANTNVIARVEAKVLEHQGVPTCIFRLNNAYVQHSWIEFTLDQKKSYHPFMLSIQEAVDHFSKSKTGGLDDLEKKEWEPDLLSKLNSFNKE